MDKKLSEMTVGDIIDSERFAELMKQQVEAERETYQEWQRKAFSQKMRLKRGPIDSLIEREVFTGEKMVALYRGVVNKALVGFSSAERGYIQQVGLVVYAKVINELKEQEKEKQ